MVDLPPSVEFATLAASGAGNDLARTRLVTPKQGQAGRDFCRLGVPTLLSCLHTRRLVCAWPAHAPFGLQIRCSNAQTREIRCNDLVATAL